MESNIDEVIKYVEQYSNSFNQGIDDGLRKITELAYETVKQYCINKNLTNHIGNISIEYDSLNKRGIVSTSDIAIIFKEMGTGIIGSENPHPSPTNEFSSWTYDENQYGEEGWKYPKKDGTFGWTKGLPSGNMFYDTFNDIKKYANSTMQIEIRKTTNRLY